MKKIRKIRILDLWFWPSLYLGPTEPGDVIRPHLIRCGCASDESMDVITHHSSSPDACPSIPQSMDLADCCP